MHSAGPAQANPSPGNEPHLSADPEHERRLAYLTSESAALVEALTELAALQQGGQAAFADAATDLQRGADLLREVSERSAEQQGEDGGPAGAQGPLEEVSLDRRGQHCDVTVACLLLGMQVAGARSPWHAPCHRTRGLKLPSL